MSEDFYARINGYVRTVMKNYRPTAGGEKIIHDPIWGSVVFYPWEVRIIDSPLFQRLRNVSQVGLAESTYPAARHTRFDHSLGTAAVASRMMEQLRKDAEQRPEVAHVIGEEQVRLLRLAALLHDVGHCPYSHLSEAVYGSMPDFEALRREVRRKTGQEISPSPHEVFSYHIITSDAFISFFHRHVPYPGISTRAEASALLHRAANLVVGAVNRSENGESLSYLTGVLNGNFDADKLDYTQRDSYTAGIALTYGVERFLLKLVICKIQREGETDYRLALTEDALSTVEELIFNRSMLYHYMYRHQKVLAAEAQMRDALYALVRTGRIKHPCDFLFLTNGDLPMLFRSKCKPFTAEGAKRKTLDSLYRAFARRTLFKRAYQLSPDGFEEFSESPDSLTETLSRLRNAEEEEAEGLLREILAGRDKADRFPQGILSYIEFLRGCTFEEYVEERIGFAERLARVYETAGKPVDFDAFDVAISFQPPLKTPSDLTVADKARRPVDCSTAIGRIREWTEAFNRNKWRGYLFVAPHVDRKLAGETFRAYLKERCSGAQLPLCPEGDRDSVLF